MRTGRGGLLLAVAAAGLTAGCVDRRFVVETNVPGAQVAVDGVPIGPSPTDARWEYAGCYEFTAVAPGYQPLTQRVRFRPKWYNFPPFDFLAEVVWPFRIEDVRRVQLTLEPVRPVNPLELVNRADALRARGLNLPPSSVPEDTQRPVPRPTMPAQPTPAQQTVPPAAPVPMNFVPPFQVMPTVPAPGSTPPSGETAPPGVGRPEILPPPPGPLSGGRQ